MNGARFLKITLYYYIISLRFYIIIIASMWLFIDVLNLVWLLVLHIPGETLFISTQFLVLNLDSLFFEIPSVYYSINLNSSTICFLFSEDIYFSLCVSSKWSIFSCFICNYLRTILGWSSWDRCSFVCNFLPNK